MATYTSYKKISNDNVIDGTVTEQKLGTDTRHRLCTKWLIGNACRCSAGCCCYWCAPNCTRRVFFELWGAGGNGAGACSCNRCHHFQGAGGGYYASKMISTAPGCQYTMCAAGVYRCLSRECTGAKGCNTYVNGYGLSDLCAIGGNCGRANTAWSTPCWSCWTCCLGPTSNNADFGMGNHSGHFSATFNCHCHSQYVRPSAAPFLGTQVSQAQSVCWIRCGCWIVPPGSGGQSAMSSYCGRCCGQGGTGGPGVVKITFA